MQRLLQRPAERPGQTLKKMRLSFPEGFRGVGAESQLKGGFSKFEQRHAHMGDEIFLSHDPMRSVGKGVFGKNIRPGIIHQYLAYLLPRKGTPGQILRGRHAFRQRICHGNERGIPVLPNAAEYAGYRIIPP